MSCHLTNRLFPSLSLFSLCPYICIVTHTIGEIELDTKSASVAVVGVDRAFDFIEGEALQTYLDGVETSNTADDIGTSAGGAGAGVAAVDLEMEEPDV